MVDIVPEIENRCIDCGETISAQSRGRCVKCGHISMKRTVPDDFTEVLRALGSQRAAKHYKTSLSTLTRWRRECGMAKHHRAKPAAPMRRTGFTERPITMRRDTSHIGQAAEYLQRYGSIHRCGPAGEFDPKGDHWRRNNRVITSEQMVKAAISLGFHYDYPIADGEVPIGFDAIASIGIRTAHSYFGLTRKAVMHLKRERCPAKPGRKLREAPSDILATANKMSIRAMAAHYGASPATVQKWLRERRN
ncbi:hypothetical protein [Novosphingobium colocasiae]|uniref:hypothetical protein n=1 Tax=Novosphingobium colocasiae TaxID=1256513 RepID=UPI0035AF3763